MKSPTRQPLVAAIGLLVLALAPSAAAKGPHASLSPGPEGVEPRQPWVAELTLLELGRRGALVAHPTLILRSGRTRLTVAPKRVGAYVPRQPGVLAELRYRVRVVFPHAGRWSYTVLDGTSANRRFRFPVAVVGGSSTRTTRDVVAFAGVDPAETEPLAPEVTVVPPEPPNDGQAGPWIPAAAIALTGAGALALVRRRVASGRR